MLAAIHRRDGQKVETVLGAFKNNYRRPAESPCFGPNLANFRLNIGIFSKRCTI